MVGLDNQGSYTRQLVAPCTSTTDVVFESWSGMPNLWGRYNCWAYNPAEECEQATIWLDPLDLGSSSNVIRQAACHEIGHSLGLTHDQSDCMWNNGIPSGGLLSFHAHHVGHLQGSHDSPIGNLDPAVRGPSGITIGGWALDPDARHSPVPEIHVRVDLTWFSTGTATANRGDIGAEYPFWGPNHGFSKVLPVWAGPNNVCVSATNPASGGASTLLGCRLVP